MEPCWVKRDENCTADSLSRIVDYDDYGVTDEFFNYADTLYGPHTVDRFANESNKKLSRFNSLFWSPGTEAVDAFSVHWGNENNWLVPPVYLLRNPKVLNFLLFCKAAGTIVAPYWPSSPFFPLLFAEGSVFAQYIVEVLVLKDSSKIYMQFRGTIFGSDKFTSKVLLVRIARAVRNVEKIPHS